MSTCHLYYRVHTPCLRFSLSNPCDVRPRQRVRTFCLTMSHAYDTIGEGHSHKVPNMLCLPGPEHPFRYDGDFKIRGSPIHIHQEGGAGRGTAWCVWDGAAVLARYIDLCGEDVFSGRHSDCRLAQGIRRPSCCVELGSGTGLVGLSAAQCFQVPIVLTDLPAALPALQANIDLNPGLKSLAVPVALDWAAPVIADVSHALRTACCRLGDPISSTSMTVPHVQLLSACDGESVHADQRARSEELADSGICGQASDPAMLRMDPVLILASDCVWVQSLVVPFVTTLHNICSVFAPAVALIAHKSRSKQVDQCFFNHIQQMFEVQHMPVLAGEWRGSTQVIKLTPLQPRG
eukprot:jgi/Ulvmu1/6195/UM028_0051.1